jgi:hypothetical protein
VQDLRSLRPLLRWGRSVPCFAGEQPKVAAMGGGEVGNLLAPHLLAKRDQQGCGFYLRWSETRGMGLRMLPHRRLGSLLSFKKAWEMGPKGLAYTTPLGLLRRERATASLSKATLRALSLERQSNLRHPCRVVSLRRRGMVAPTLKFKKRAWKEQGESRHKP